VTDRHDAEIALHEAHARLEQRVVERTKDLADANVRFRAIFDQGLFAALLSLDGTVVDVNRSWLEASGFSREELLQHPVWEAAWWRDSPDVQAWIKIGFGEASQGEAFRGETVFTTASGERRMLDLALMPIRDDAGQITLIITTALDSTERHRVERELQRAEMSRASDARFRHLANTAPVLIWMADIDNAGTWFNQRWLDFVGRPLEQELGDGWLEN